jgi:hypothetical protein
VSILGLNLTAALFKVPTIRRAVWSIPLAAGFALPADKDEQQDTVQQDGDGSPGFENLQVAPYRGKYSRKTVRYKHGSHRRFTSPNKCVSRALAR